MRDFQQPKVYRWEDRVIGSRDTRKIDQPTAKAVLDYIWLNEGLLYPPKLEALRRGPKAGDATRTTIRLVFPSYTWILIHELCHVLNTTVDWDGDGESHGPSYVGIYMRMIEKYLNIPLPILMYTAKQAGIEFDLAARVAFLDA